MRQPRIKLRSASEGTLAPMTAGRCPRGLTREVSILYACCTRPLPVAGAVGLILKNKLQSMAQGEGNSRKPVRLVNSLSPKIGNGFGRVVFNLYAGRTIEWPKRYAAAE